MLGCNEPAALLWYTTTPSAADIQLTKKLKEAGHFLDLPILDHLIYSDQGYYSFADEGML